MRRIVLVVDGDETVRGAVNELIGSKYTYCGFSNAEDALQWVINGNIPSVVITEYSLAGMSGLEFFRELKTIEGCSIVPVIFLTGITDDNPIKEVLKEVPSSYILKPIDSMYLMVKIEEAVKYNIRR